MIFNKSVGLRMLFLLFCQSNTFATPKPQYIIPIVIDQGAFHYFTRFGDYFQHGFRRLLDESVNFNNTHHPHAAPLTATGHATLSTGCCANKHGIIMNSWYTPQGKPMASVDTTQPKAQVLPAHGSCSCKASSCTIMAPSISDIVAQASTDEQEYYAYGISFKDRAAIGMAGHQGKAIWFDEHQQAFTSNREYFDQLPPWVVNFNKTLAQKIKNARTWKLCLDPKHEIYTNFAKEIYHLSTVSGTIAGTTLGGKGDWKKLKGTHSFIIAPQSNQILFDLALECMAMLKKEASPAARALIWLSLSSLDKVGHMYGPHSLETIDTLLHLDKMIGNFMDIVTKHYGKDNVLFVLTADHGVSPIPENMFEENHKHAKRIVMYKEVKKLNLAIKKKFKIKNLFYGFKTNQLFWNETLLSDLPEEEVQEIINFVKEYFYNLGGIKKIWSYQELDALTPEPASVEQLFKNQLYKGRSGAFFLLGKPFVMLSNYDRGSCHRTPYNHDTQVPLMIHYPAAYAPRKVRKKTWTTQLAPTIAKIWGLEPAATMEKTPLTFIF